MSEIFNSSNKITLTDISFSYDRIRYFMDNAMKKGHTKVIVVLNQYHGAKTDYLYNRIIDLANERGLECVFIDD